MPYLDGTGPNGKGPKTGRGQGTCNDPKQAVDNKPKVERKYKSGYRQ